MQRREFTGVTMGTWITLVIIIAAGLLLLAGCNERETHVCKDGTVLSGPNSRRDCEELHGGIQEQGG